MISFSFAGTPSVLEIASPSVGAADDLQICAAGTAIVLALGRIGSALRTEHFDNPRRRMLWAKLSGSKPESITEFARPLFPEFGVRRLDAALFGFPSSGAPA